MEHFVNKIIQQAGFSVNQILITSYAKGEQYIGGLIIYKCQGTNTLSTWFKFSVIAIVHLITASSIQKN